MKYAIFDFDGTISENGNIWAKIFEYFDDKETDNQYYNMFYSGEITNKEWFDLIFDRFKKLGLSSKIVSEITGETKIKNGVLETFEKLHNDQIKIIILSGGVKNAIVEKMKDFMPYIFKIEAIDFIFDKNDILCDFVFQNHKLDDKADFIENLIVNENLSKDDILFVGNGDNDEIIARTGVKMLCISPENTDGNDRNIWTHSIETFDEILNHI